MKKKKVNIKKLIKNYGAVSQFDPMGSYTGTPNGDFGSTPTQDADDL